jgi:GNAT superfamily N-acetyltransferase
LLGSSHELDGFVCRSVEQTEWLRRHARTSASAGTTRVLVVTPTDSEVVVAYYAWCMASVSVADAPMRLRKGAGRYPQPVALLARLGVDVAQEGRGLGAGLLQDVIARTLALGEEIGCRGLLVHAETPEARDFYDHLVPEFEVSPTDELHLLLLMKDIRRTLRRPGTAEPPSRCPVGTAGGTQTPRSLLARRTRRSLRQPRDAR